jgi:hypothetical protein
MRSRLCGVMVTERFFPCKKENNRRLLHLDLQALSTDKVNLLYLNPTLPVPGSRRI